MDRLVRKPYPFATLLILSGYFAQNPLIDFLLLIFLTSILRNRVGLLVGVLLSSQVFDLEIQGSTYRAILVFGLILFIINPFKSSGFTNSKITLGVVAYVPLLLSALFGDYTNSFIVATQFSLLGIISFWICKKVIIDETSFKRDFLRGLIFVAYLNSLVVISQVFRLGSDKLSTHLYEGRPTGLYLEPDFLGFFAVIGITAVLYLRLNKYSLLLSLPIIFTLIFSLARAAWLSICVVSVLYIFSNKNLMRPLVKGISVIVLLALFLITGVELIPAKYFEVISNRVQSIHIADPQDSARLARIRQWQGLSELAMISPWYGSGLTASGRIEMHGNIANYKTWNNVGSNWVLSIWAEAKFLSIPYFLFILFAIFKSRRSFFQTAIIATIINSLFTNMMWYSITPFLLVMAVQTSSFRTPNQAEIPKV